jgi:thiazole synthase
MDKRIGCEDTNMRKDLLEIAAREFCLRLIVGTGKYRSFQEMVRAHEASGAEMVTVAVRRAWREKSDCRTGSSWK